jgi:hypothetical protein
MSKVNVTATALSFSAAMKMKVVTFSVTSLDFAEPRP